MKRKIAVIKSGFTSVYLEYLLRVCHENNVQIMVFENSENYMDFIEEFDYVLVENICLPYCCRVFHAHSIREKVNRVSSFLYRVIFYLGHLKRIIKTKREYTSMPKLIVVSQEVKKDLVRNYGISPEKIIVAHAGFIKNKNNDLKPAPKFDYGDVFTVAMNAKGFVSKGGYVLLNALRIFKKLYPQIKIKANIIYPNYRKNFMVRLFVRVFGLQGNVEFFDLQQDMDKFYEQANCFICASHLEAFGRVVTEAMYNKIPVIIGSNIGAVDIVKDGVNGFVYEYFDKNRAYNLAQKIKQVWENYNSLDAVIENAYKDCQNITWENFVRQIFEGLYGANKSASSQSISTN